MPADAMWVILWAMVGACVGSFLNVVAYRLPRGLSLVSPPSRCPACNKRIAWYDNVPVLGWVWLGGRCRNCHVPISPSYSIVEMATALGFAAIYDAFYRVGSHGGFDPSAWSVEWPVFLGHAALVAALVVISVLDIRYYLIDLRIIYITVVVGLLGWAAGWRADGAYVWPIGGTMGLAIALGVVVGEVLRRIVGAMCCRPKPQDDGAEDVADESWLNDDEDSPAEAPSPAAVVVRWLAVSAYLVIGAVLLIGMVFGATDASAHAGRAWGTVAWVFVAILLGCMPKRSSDTEIVEAIEAEKSSARRVALGELLAVLPGVVGGIVAGWLTGHVSAVGEALAAAQAWTVAGVQPVMGLTAGLVGMVSAVAMGWFIRIFFTLLFGKEAMGSGDIYILAAMGACAGPLVAVVGFFVGSVIGVLGIVVLLLWKTSRALSYGPWIAIGGLVCMLFYDAFVRFFRPAVEMVCTMFSNVQ